MAIKGILGAGLSVVALAGAGYGAGSLYLESAAKDRAEIIVQDLRRRGATVTYGRIDSALLSSGLTINNVRVVSPTKETVKIQRIDVRNFDWQNPENPRHVDVRLFGVSMDPDQGQQALPFAAKVLLDAKNIFDVDLQHRYDPETRNLTLKKLSLMSKKLGTLTLSLKLGSFTIPKGQYVSGGQINPMVLMQLFAGGATFDGASIKFQDRGLVDRLFKAYAAKTGDDEDTLKRKTLDRLRAEKRSVKYAFQRELLDAVIAFIDRPGALSVISAPPKPVPVGRFISRFAANPDGLKSLMGLRISYK